MNYNAIAQLLDNGLSADEVVSTLLRSTPKIAKKIRNMLAGGLGTPEVLRGLMRDPDARNIDISKGRGSSASEAQSLSLLKSYNSVPDSRDQESLKYLQNFTKNAINIGSSVGGAYALSRAIPKAVQAIPQAMQQILQGQQQNQITEQAGAQGIQSTGPQQTNNFPQQPPVNPSSIAQPQQSPQVQAAIRDPSKNIQLIKNIGEDTRIRNLIDQGMNPRDIAGVVRKVAPKDKLQALETAEGGLEGAIEDYAKGEQQQPQQQPAMEPQGQKLDEAKETERPEIEQPTNFLPKPTELVKESKNALGLTPQKARGLLDKLIAFDEPIYDKHFGKGFYRNKLMKMSEKERDQWLNENADKFTKEDMSKFQSFYKNWNPEHTIENLQNAIGSAAQEKIEEKPKPIAKKETVSTPEGIGEVKEIRNGKALVEVEGKKHVVNEEDLEPPLFSEDQIADAYDDLMKMIPEEHRSGFISWAGYDEDRKVLGYIPRGGKYEELTNITPEEAELVKTGKGVARTSGEKREGFWVVGGDTRGLISQIQHDRRKKRESLDKQQLKLFELPKKEKEDKGMKPLFDEMAHARGLSQAREKKKKDEEKARLKKEKDEAKKRKKQT